MVAANGVTARFLDAHGFPSIRRVVRSPERWDRIGALAREPAIELPAAPDSRGARRVSGAAQSGAIRIRFADLSHTIIKLLGPGEYVVDPPGAEPPGHFGLAVQDYTHSTAPNRRYPDLLTQRLVKAALAGRPSPYSIDELEAARGALHAAGGRANKVERQVRKSAAALVVESRVGRRSTRSSPARRTRARSCGCRSRRSKASWCEATGVSTWAIASASAAGVDVERGFIDFVRA